MIYFSGLFFLLSAALEYFPLFGIYNYRQEHAGFLKLGLQCNYASNGSEKYIISKTLLENTSKRPIKVVSAFLIIVDQQISYNDAIDLVMEVVLQKIPSIRKK